VIRTAFIADFFFRVYKYKQQQQQKTHSLPYDQAIASFFLSLSVLIFWFVDFIACYAATFFFWIHQKMTSFVEKYYYSQSF